MQGWRQRDSGAGSRVGGQEPSTGTASVRVSLTCVFVNYQLRVLSAWLWAPAVKVHTCALGHNAL